MLPRRVILLILAIWTSLPVMPWQRPLSMSWLLHWLCILQGPERGDERWEVWIMERNVKEKKD